MPDNFLIVPSADVQGGRLTTLSNAISTTDLNLTVTALANGTELVVYQLSTGVTGTPQGVAQPGETHVFALMGQSNMIGRADFDGGAKWPAGTLQIGRDGVLIPAQNPSDGPATSRPLAHSNPTPGDMGLDIQFAIDYLAEKPNVTLLFIPCAQGATGFSNGAWNPGDGLYTDTVARINAAMTANPGFLFKGFLWHQGETDTGIPDTYAELLDTMIRSVRSDVTTADATTPFILGGLAAGNAARDAITALIATTPDRVAHTGFAAADDLSLADANHFDATALRSLGARYQAALSAAQSNTTIAPTAPLNLMVTAGDAQADLVWEAPAASGSAQITDYLIERDAGTGFTPLADGVSTDRSYSDIGLTNGVLHRWRVSAVSSAGTGPASAIVSATPVAATLPPTGPAPEAGATAHWLFGTDNPTYADLVSGRIATGPAHALSAGYMTSPAGVMQGRDTGIAEADAQTMCFVFRLAGSTNSMIGGTLTTSGGNGVSPYTSGPTSIYANMRGGWGNPAVTTTSPYMTDFVFVAVSKNVSTRDYVIFAGAASGNEVLSATSNQTTSPRTIGIGNLHFDRANFSGQISIAEAIVFAGSRSVQELEDIYQRTRTRLAARGLTLS